VGRFVQRNKSLVKLVVMEPGLATAAEHADVLYMNQLPFENDLRSLTFPAFTYRTDKPQVGQGGVGLCDWWGDGCDW
jgi:hypothetical protein